MCLFKPYFESHGIIIFIIITFKDLKTKIIDQVSLSNHHFLLLKRVCLFLELRACACVSVYHSLNEKEIGSSVSIKSQLNYF